MNPEFPVYSFKLEYFDEPAELVRPYYLTYRTERGEIEIFDIRNHRPFLKRTVLHNIQIKDLYVGNKLLINGRQYDVVDIADSFTRDAFSSTMQHTYAMLKPGYYQYLGEALDRIYQSGLVVANLQLGCISRSTASKFYAEHQGKSFYEQLVSYITSGPIFALELVGPNAISKWRELIGPTNLDNAKRDAPTSLRAMYARSTTENFAHGSDSPASAEREIGLIFGKRSVNLISKISNSTLCVIKPHAIKSGLAGKIIMEITHAGFQITGAMMTKLNLETASEFYDVYRGVANEFVDMCKEISSGSVIALELSGDGDYLNEFRQLCGPYDVPVAKAIRPNSIRAKYGLNKVQNAVHCTDLYDDAQLECEYFFTLLANE
ncbi:Nucleoside diphosphate kinase family protein [Tritrichomonas foetus]|uniref:Nucleoside diphosphate kinase n=1 Tax=Tritrichomonas foetus TaxID=1144522 RepID=A0A1J4K1V1_9EUKA|nr:Nucleoside diphosphate kinase family protein [Tritrichomonas foetus]|eukprot:OHT03453.1 Nucleoside diphosphate kinase family protein [Tritrichomonas foetus]